MKKIKQTTMAIICFLAAGTSFGSVINDTTYSGYSVLTNGSLSTSNNVSITGNVGAGSIWLANNTNIDGNVYSGSGISTGNNVTVNGNINYNSSFWMPGTSGLSGDINQQSWQAPAISSIAVNSGSDSLYYSKSSNVNLDAGSYNSLSVSKGSTVYLSSGIYNFSSAWFDKDVNIVVDTSAGDVFINTAQSFTTGHHVSLTTNGNGNAYIVSAGSFYIDQHNDIAASLIAKNDGSISNSSIINGIIYASNSIWLGNDVSISGLATMPSAAVPEPATALLLLTAVPFLRNRRRHNINS